MEPQLCLCAVLAYLLTYRERRARMPVANMKGGGNANIRTEISA